MNKLKLDYENGTIINSTVSKYNNASNDREKKSPQRQCLIK